VSVISISIRHSTGTGLPKVFPKGVLTVRVWCLDLDTVVEVGFALKATSRGCQLDSDWGGVPEGIREGTTREEEVRGFRRVLDKSRTMMMVRGLLGRCQSLWGRARDSVCELGSGGNEEER
jgi:hypothetical protein